MIHQSKKDIETARQLALEQKGKKADAVVVLGAKVRKDGSMCLMLKERVDLRDPGLQTGTCGPDHYER